MNFIKYKHTKTVPKAPSLYVKNGNIDNYLKESLRDSVPRMHYHTFSFLLDLAH